MQHAEQLGIQVFNNLNNTTAEYSEICTAFKDSCEKIHDEVEKIKRMIPGL